MTIGCKNCDGAGWVCESHNGKPWRGMSSRKDACDCGAGSPCPICNWDMAVAGREAVAFAKGKAEGVRSAVGYFDRDGFWSRVFNWFRGEPSRRLLKMADEIEARP